MVADLLAYVLLGVVQVATAVWGGIVSALTIPAGAERRFHVGTFVALGLFGCALIVWSGLRTFDTQRASNSAQSQLQEDLGKARDGMNQSLRRQEYMRGQLDSISLLVGRASEKSADPVLGQFAGAIAKMATNAKNTMAETGVSALRIVAEGKELRGRTFSYDNAGIARLPEIMIANDGPDTTSGPVIIRLFANGAVHFCGGGGLWQPMSSSSDEEYQVELDASSNWRINAGEVWHAGTVCLQANDEKKPPAPVRLLLKTFYGAQKPLDTQFSIR